MLDNALKAIQQIGHFSTEDLVLLAEKLEYKKLSKGTFLLQPSEVCKAFYFLHSGAIRQYTTVDQIEELTLNLYRENDWLADHKSFTLQKPSANFIEAVENCEVVEMHMNNVHELISRSPSFFQLGKLMEIVNQDAKRYDLLKIPEEKYRTLLAHNPGLLLKFPLKHIASYLRMTPETLSRVRKNISSRV